MIPTISFDIYSSGFCFKILISFMLIRRMFSQYQTLNKSVFVFFFFCVRPQVATTRQTIIFWVKHFCFSVLPPAILGYLPSDEAHTVCMWSFLSNFFFLLQMCYHIPYPWDSLGNRHKGNRRNRNKHKSPNFPYPP